MDTGVDRLRTQVAATMLERLGAGETEDAA